MPYEIRKLKRGHYEVLNSETGQVHAKQTSLAKAKAQVRLLGMKHADGGHRGVAHPKTKKQIHDYFQKWYKKNRKSVLRRMEKQRLAGGATAVQRMPDFSKYFALENAPPPPPPPNPKRKRGDDPVPYEKKKKGRFPSLNQLRGLYEEIRPRFNNRDEAGANAELDMFIADNELTDELRAEWHMEDPEAEDLFGNIFQLVAGGDELFDAGYVAPVNVFGLDSGEMDEVLEGAGYSGGANGDDDDEGQTDSEMDTDDEDEVNPLALPHFWDGQQWVPVVPNPPPANLMEDDEILEGNGYYRMKNGCALYTGGSIQPINYSSELKDNSWYPMGYSGGARVMPVNHSAELKSSFGTF